jgi:hypothetical protein
MSIAEAWMKDDVPLSSKVTVRLSPYEARELRRLRTEGLPHGARPRTATQVIVEALLHAAACGRHR